ncbi:CocE/NonD family hydrolase [Sphaerisporangium album]|uniref:CocE/NonD family hydrolase n=1 Tax=Sphaerisporangium album TaxID=509200 RepID=UPI001C68FD85|nr:CocE/NonD family hydrolase [Sphaerisporangium album]
MKAAPGLGARAVDQILRRLRKLPAPRNNYVVERTVRTPTRGGSVLLSDLYSPADPDADTATILIRTPYGRGMPVDALWGRTFAARGYHVLLQSVRGTFGSTGTFRPMAQEAEDAQDTVAWLRQQPWFNGNLATMGMSYVAFTQWALLIDPPPELRASVMIAGPHDFSSAIWEDGAFALETFLGWSERNSVPFDQQPGPIGQLLGRRRSGERHKEAFTGLPLAQAAQALLEGRAPWVQEWLDHPDLADPYWQPYNHTEALRRIQTPTLLVGGWQDVFIGQTVAQYEALRSRGIDVAMTLGPWTHFAHLLKGSAVIDNEALDWLDSHLGHPAARRRPQPVRTFVTGADTWHAAPVWPPESVETAWYPTADGALVGSAPAGGHSSFRYDPSDPTPSTGGRRLSSDSGVQDNRELEARSDVLTFTTPALAASLEFEGFPVLEAFLSVDNPHADLFVRLCDLDAKGRSRNLTDVLIRLDPTVGPGELHHVTVRLNPCAHRLLAGHRLRLQISGGSHPQYARNLGTGEPVATGAGLKASVHTLHHGSTRLILPVTSAAASTH